MLQKPDIPDERIAFCLGHDYALDVAEIAFLPLGADAASTVYRVNTRDHASYFLKLRRRTGFTTATVEIPRFLHDQGIAPIIAPLVTTSGRSWTSLEGFAVMVYPFIEGRNGFETPLSNTQWIELGTALRGIQTVAMPLLPGDPVPREEYSPIWRNLVRKLQVEVRQAAFSDAVAARFAAFLHSRHEIITDLVERAESLATALREQPPPCVLCHGDLHAGNVLLGKDGRLHLVDWDTTILAPKERDLMFIGGGIGGVWNQRREAALFYQGYGPTEVDPIALAYYRYERIVEDIAAFGDELLLTAGGGAARTDSLGLFLGQFKPNDVVEIAYRSDPWLNPRA